MATVFIGYATRSGTTTDIAGAVAEQLRDLDHTVEYSDTGPPGQTSTENLAPLCRTHHRAKTHPSPTGLPGGAGRATR